MTSSEPIEFEVSDRVAIATLNRPDSYNSLDLAAAEAWRTIARTVSTRDDVGAFIIAARGRAFCAGGDLRSMAEGGGTLVAQIASALHEGILALVTSTLPVVAAVSGTVAGGGLGMLLASDYAVASENATFSARYSAMGLSPDMSVTALLARAVGERRGMELVMRDRSLTAAEALDWGLIAEVVSPDQVLVRANEIASEWAANTNAIGQTKRLMRTAASRDLAETLRDEADTIAILVDGEVSRTRVQGFLARSDRRT